MATTSDDIERMLQAIEGRQVKCPECGSTDAHIKRATYEIAAVRFTMTGEIIVGETHDYSDPQSEFLSMLVCHPCHHEWPVPEGVTFQWESIICECEEAKLRRQHEERVFLSSQGPKCENAGCGVECMYEVQGTRSDGIPYGRWVHVGVVAGVGDHSHACAVKAKTNGKEHTQYARVTLG